MKTDNKYLRVYIKTEYSKAKITLNGKIYTGITDDDTVISGSNVVNGGDIHGILIPVKDGESVKVIPYVVTSEDGRHTSNNALNVTIQSINTNADYVTVNGVEAYGPFTEAIRICRIITAIFLTVYMKKQLIMPKRHRLLFRRLFSRRIQQQNFYGKMATLIITEMMLNTTFRSEYPTHTCLTMQILIFLMWLNSELSLKRVQCKNMT